MGKPVFVGVLVVLLARAGWAEDEPIPEPSYYELKPSLVVNLPSGGKYVRCDVQLMTLEPDLLEGINTHAPAIRHELLMLFSEQDGSRLQTAEGKEDLRQQAIAAVRMVMREQTGEDAVDEVFFTAFFVQ